MTVGATYAENLEDTSASHVPGLDPRELYSLVPFPDDYWTRAETRHCFTTEQDNVQVTLSDVDPGRDGIDLLLLIDCLVLMSR